MESRVKKGNWVWRGRAFLGCILCFGSCVLAMLTSGAIRPRSFHKTTATPPNIVRPDALPAPVMTYVPAPGESCPTASVDIGGICVPQITGPASALSSSKLFASSQSSSTSAGPSDWLLQPRREPIRRAEPQMAYDPVHHNVVLFGGVYCHGGTCGRLGDTWTFDGTAWQEQHPATSPPVRASGAMVFDRNSGKVLLFGGLICTDPLCENSLQTNDTWAWDGTNWTQLNPLVAPTPRYSFAVTYDATINRVLLYGGCLTTCDTVSADLWSWNGSNWSLLSASAPPGPRFGTHFAYDAVHHNSVLFSGVGENSGATLNPDLSDTWTFDGTNWTQQSPAHMPEGREGGGMVWDATRQRVVLFGGFSSRDSGYSNAIHQDTWLWDGSDWTRLETPVSPARNYYLGLVYDDAIGKTVLYGGENFILEQPSTGAGVLVYQKSVWLLDSKGWSTVPDAEPNDRSRALIAYFPPTHSTLMFGGHCLDQPDTWCHDAWEWNGASWKELHPPVLLIGGSGIAYDSVDRQLVVPVAGTTTATWDGATWTFHSDSADPAMLSGYPAVTRDVTGRPILFGGINTTTSYRNDLYRWDGSYWQKLNPSSSPPGRELMQAAYDEAHRQTVVFGGLGCANALSALLCGTMNDTWTWDGTNWTQPQPAQSPPARDFGYLAFNRATQSTVLFGGSGASDTWTWDGTNWTQVSPSASPGQLLFAGMSTDSARPNVVLFGGQLDNPGRDVSDTWTFGSDSPPLQLVDAVSRKTHGARGVFDIEVSPNDNYVECRSGGVTGDYRVVFTFTYPLLTVASTTVTGGPANVGSSGIADDAHQYVVSLTGVTTPQRLTIKLAGVQDENGDVISAQTDFDVLVGDLSGDGAVNSADITATKRQSGQILTLSNFRADVNGDGDINSADISLVKSKSGTALP